MTEAINVGDARKLNAAFNNIDGTPTDPVVVSVKVREPGQTPVEYVYGIDPEVIRVQDGEPTAADGVYYLDIPLDYAGTYNYSWKGEGIIDTVEGSSFAVLNVGTCD